LYIFLISTADGAPTQDLATLQTPTDWRWPARPKGGLDPKKNQQTNKQKCMFSKSDFV